MSEDESTRSDLDEDESPDSRKGFRGWVKSGVGSTAAKTKDVIGETNSERITHAGETVKQAARAAGDKASKTSAVVVDRAADWTSWSSYRVALESILDEAFRVISAQQLEIEELQLRLEAIERNQSGRGDGPS